MFPKVEISIERHGAVYDVRVGDPPVKRRFFGEHSLAEYIATRFTMGIDEALGLLRELDMKDGRCVVASIPIPPENIASL